MPDSDITSLRGHFTFKVWWFVDVFHFGTLYLQLFLNSRLSFTVKNPCSLFCYKESTSVFYSKIIPTAFSSQSKLQKLIVSFCTILIYDYFWHHPLIVWNHRSLLSWTFLRIHPSDHQNGWPHPSNADIFLLIQDLPLFHNLKYKEICWTQSWCNLFEESFKRVKYSSIKSVSNVLSDISAWNSTPWWYTTRALWALMAYHHVLELQLTYHC